jgi:GxxExxY protein
MTKDELDLLSKRVIGAALEVHRNLGPGLRESVYEQCLVKELRQRGMRADCQVIVPLRYKGEELNEDFSIDVLVEGELILELKAVDAVEPLHEAQLLSFMKLANKRLGLLINFNVPLLRDGIRRKIYDKDYYKDKAVAKVHDES